ncbi:MAG: hypothetical protein V4697_00035 [Patescibacteria group bacterium]
MTDPDVTVVSAPTLQDLQGSPQGQQEFERGIEFQERSARSTHILGVSMEGQEAAWRRREMQMQASQLG